MIKIGIGILLGAGLLVSVFVAGGTVERLNCNDRIKTAVAKFEKLQTDVKAIVEEFEQSVDIEKGDKDDAAIVKEIMARLKAKTAPVQCLIDGADVADAGRLRDGPRTSPK